MARRPIPETNVEIVIGTGCRIDGRDYRPNDIAAVPASLADDMKSMRQARDLTPQEAGQRSGYLRRDVQAG